MVNIEIMTQVKLQHLRSYRQEKRCVVFCEFFFYMHIIPNMSHMDTKVKKYSLNDM